MEIDWLAVKYVVKVTLACSVLLLLLASVILAVVGIVRVFFYFGYKLLHHYRLKLYWWSGFICGRIHCFRDWLEERFAR